MLDFKHFILSQWLIKKVLFCFALLCACVFKILMISCFFSMVAGLYLAWVILCKPRSLCLTLFPVNDSRFLMMIQLCYSECKIGIYLPKKLWVITNHPFLFLNVNRCASIQAIETNSRSDTQKLIAYWVSVSVVLLFERAFQLEW